MNDVLARLQAWDASAFLAVNSWLHHLTHRNEEIENVLRAANELGSGWILLFVLLALVGAEVSFCRAARRLAEIGLAALTAGLGTWFVKRWVDRPRPGEALAEAFRDGRAHFAFGIHLRDAGWPSGHAAGAFALAVVVWWWAAETPDAWRRVFVRVGIVLMASLTALARVYGGAHYPGDVLCGAVFGVVVGWLTVATSRALAGPYRRPAPRDPAR